jgi:hypothetical protein
MLNKYTKERETMTEPNPQCPNCEGKGQPITSEWDSKRHQYVSVDKIGPCPLCSCLYADIYKAAKELELLYTGKASDIDPQLQDEIFLGDDGARYRRLLKWVWAHPPNSGTKDGFPEGLTKKARKRLQSTPFKKLFNFERKIRAPKRYKPVETCAAVIPWFCADVKPLLDAWNQIVKSTKRNSNLPILRHVCVTTALNSVTLDATTLQKWDSASIPADTYSQAGVCVPGTRMLQILRSCDRKGMIAFGFEPEAVEDDRDCVVIGHGNSVWRVHTLPTEHFPSKRYWEKRQVA